MDTQEFLFQFYFSVSLRMNKKNGTEQQRKIAKQEIGIHIIALPTSIQLNRLRNKIYASTNASIRT